ncbi:unnamed protein product [Caretta caretta]
MQPQMEEEMEICCFKEKMLCAVFQPQKLANGPYVEVFMVIFLLGQPKGVLRDQESQVKSPEERVGKASGWDMAILPILWC